MSASPVECDVVRLTKLAAGWAEPAGEEVALPPGAEGTVELRTASSDLLLVEFVDTSSGATTALAEIPASEVVVTRRASVPAA